MQTANLDLEPEFTSLEDFVDFLNEDERDSFNHVELHKLASSTGVNFREVMETLKEIGFKLAERRPEKAVRTFSSNGNDRWYGPGSSPCHGGSGHEQISGFAGRVG